MQGGLQHGDAVVLQHVQEGSFARVVEPEEEQFGVLVCETEVREDFPDCGGRLARCVG